MNNQQILNATDADLPKMIDSLKANGWSADDTTTLDQAKNMAQFQAFLDGSL